MYKWLSFSLLWVWAGGLWGGEPLAVYLTWVHDPATTMVVLWHTEGGDTGSTASYKERGKDGWQEASGESWMVSGVDVRVHSVELQGLKEGAEYAFKVGAREYWFRTMPKDLKQPVRFAVGGDIFYKEEEERLEKMNRLVAGHHPDFVVLGGDIAYAFEHGNSSKGKAGEKERWEQFFKHWEKEMTDGTGRMVPLIPVVGNHDVKRFHLPEMFYEIFIFPQKNVGYRALDFGEYLSLILLDSGHTYPVEGKQARWLEEALKSRTGMGYKVPIYHVAAFPGYYPYTQETAEKIRAHWVPLFEKYGVKMAFEHHNHVYSQTYPMKNGKVDPEGIIYFGGGSWAVPPRTPHPLEEAWYLNRAKQMNAVYLITLDEKGASIKVLSY